jgi:hypothetical protein
MQERIEMLDPSERGWKAGLEGDDTSDLENVEIVKRPTPLLCSNPLAIHFASTTSTRHINAPYREHEV